MPQPNPLLSVIIVSWNAGCHLAKCLDHVLKQTYTPIEIIVVDNNSTDGSIESLPQTGAAGIQILRQSANEGFPFAINRGVAASRGKYVLFLNQDMFLADAFVAQAVEAFERLDTERVAAVGGIVYVFRRGQCTDEIESVGWHLLPYHRVTNSKNTTEMERVFGPAGSAPVFLKSALDDVRLPNGEYLESSYFFSGEDVELYLRLQLFRWKCLFLPVTSGWHVGSASAGASGFLRYPDHLQVHVIKNRLATILTCYPACLWLRTLPWHVVAFLGQVGYALVTWNWRLLRNWIVALATVMEALPNLLRKRRWLQASKRVSCRYLGSLFVQQGAWDTLRSLLPKA